MIKLIQNLNDPNNSKFWAYTDLNIGFIIKLFTNHYDILKNYIDFVKEGLMKLIKWLKENPYPPTMSPIKNLNMYKKRTTSFPNKLNNVQFNNFVQRYTNFSNEKINKLSDIIKSIIIYLIF